MRSWPVACGCTYGRRIVLELKTSLSAEEKLRAACAKVVFGVPDAAIALVLGVSNVARVNEGIKEVLAPLGLAAPGYKAAEGIGDGLGSAIIDRFREVPRSDG